MIYSITAKAATQNMLPTSKTAHLIDTVAFYLKRILKSHRQLSIISDKAKDQHIYDASQNYLTKQNKLVSIALDLQKRIIHSINHNVLSQKLEKQFKQEIEILDWMHFEMTKKFFSFINTHFEARLIKLNKPMAA